MQGAASSLDVSGAFEYVEETLSVAFGGSITLRSVATVRNVAVVDTTNDLTGVMVWPGARAFCSWLRHAAEKQRDANDCVPSDATLATADNSRNILVLELGGGIGIGAMITAATLCKVHCVVSDFYAPALELCEALVRGNVVTIQRFGSVVSTHQYDWTRALHRPPSLADVAGGSSDCPSSLCILGLDVVYPDTRHDVLLGLLCTVRSLLEHQHAVGGVEVAPRQVVFQAPGFYTVFAQRDTGLTLRRLLVGAAAMGLRVDPIALPETRDLATSVDAFPDLSLAADADKATEVTWSALAKEFEDELSQCDDLDGRRQFVVKRIAARGTWFLRLRLSDGVPQPSTAHRLIADGCVHQHREAYRRSTALDDAWLRLMPWIWLASPADDVQHSRAVLWCNNTFSIEPFTDWLQIPDEAQPTSSSECVECTALAAHRAAAQAADEASFFGSFQSDDDG